MKPCTAVLFDELKSSRSFGKRRPVGKSPECLERLWVALAW